jgi:hypothetical protein
MRELEIAERQTALEKQRKPLDRDFQGCRWEHKKRAGFCRMMFLVCFTFHILLAIWVFQDIRKRGTGSGVWIALALLTGFWGTLLYVIVRLADKKEA